MSLKLSLAHRIEHNLTFDLLIFPQRACLHWQFIERAFHKLKGQENSTIEIELSFELESVFDLREHCFCGYPGCASWMAVVVTFDLFLLTYASCRFLSLRIDDLLVYLVFLPQTFPCLPRCVDAVAVVCLSLVDVDVAAAQNIIQPKSHAHPPYFSGEWNILPPETETIPWSYDRLLLNDASLDSLILDILLWSWLGCSAVISIKYRSHHQRGYCTRKACAPGIIRVQCCRTVKSIQSKQNSSEISLKQGTRDMVSP